MNKKFKILYILLCFCLVFSLTSCGNDYSEKTVYFSSVDGFNSFDPQIASTSVEINVASNCFEGLLTKDKDGKIVNGCAEEYSVSSDKKTYTFKLKDNLVWSDGETKLTASDFEFGIKRAVMKSTNAPNVSLLYCIKNAKNIYNGKMSIDKLGVKADKNVLTITLQNKSDEFLNTLTMPVCAPCNKEFFDSTIGKYGLSSSKILSNGAFYVSRYNKDDKTVSIVNNQNYSGDFNAKIRSVTINYSSDYKDIYKAFEDKKIDLASVECAYINSLEEKGNKTKLFYNTNYCLYISDKTVPKNIRKGLMLGINNDTILNNIVGNYGVAKGIIPENNIFGNDNYREKAGSVAVYKYNKKKALKSIGSYDEASQLLNGLQIYYPQVDDKIKLLSNLIVQGWQKDFNLYINSCGSTVSEIEKGLKSKEISIAVVPVSSDNNFAQEAILSLKKYGIKQINIKGNSIKSIYNAEKQFVDNFSFYPIVSIPDAISYASDIDNLVTSSDGFVIDFRFITKE